MGRLLWERIAEGSSKRIVLGLVSSAPRGEPSFRDVAVAIGFTRLPFCPPSLLPAFSFARLLF